MCGRARCTVGVDDVGRVCGFSAPLRTVDSDRFRPSFNMSPGRYMPVVRNAAQAGDSAEKVAAEPVVHCMKWGLVPSFSKKNEKPDHFRMFNARSESVRQKPSFCRLLPKSRCVTTVEGFYEWKKDGAKKQPYYVHFKNGQPLVFAGLYDSWKDGEDNILYSFTILTTCSSKALDWLHDRMPVILPNQSAVNSWLNDDLDEASLHKITQPYEASDLVWYPVTPAMGKPAFDSPECVKEIKPKVASESKIAKLFGKAVTEIDSTEHEGVAINEEETPGAISERQDEESLTDYENKALLAGVLPDHEISQTVPSEKQMEYLSGNFEVHNSKDSDHSEELSAVKTHQSKLQTSESAKEGQNEPPSPVKQTQKDSPSAKRQRLAVSPKMGKKHDLRPSQDKQSNLLSFFGRQ